MFRFLSSICLYDKIACAYKTTIYDYRLSEIFQNLFIFVETIENNKFFIEKLWKSLFVVVRRRPTSLRINDGSPQS